MGYSALLFCPDDKTARTVTLVLSDLEFTVEACGEPFAAVKKLMGQHFDAVVVDCDNEQNATLLFKSARNSTSNQTSLAVAVVEGQAGVAKAFRIGANLVLTKPINIEQSKGTLRVARGLLRKGEPAKPAAAATPGPGSVAPATKPVAAKAVGEAKPAPAVAPLLTPEPAAVAVVKPTPAWPAAAVASATASAQDEDLLGIEEPKKAAAKIDSHAAMNLFSAEAPASSQKISTTGAASAPAPAREPAVVEEPAKKEGASAASITAEKPTQAVEAASAGSVSSFTFGGNVEAGAESSGGSKKVMVGIAAAIIVAAGLYAGVTHFRSAASEPATTDAAAASAPGNAAQPTVSTPKTNTVAEKPSATLAPGSQPSHPEANKIQSIIDEAARDSHSKNEGGNGKTASESDSESAPEPEPLMVKGGKIAKIAKPAADAPAPSMIGMAAPGADAPPTDLIPSTTPTLRPTLSTVHVSQGVSTGLLIKKVAPTYPANALRMQIEGNVELLATISKDGNITNIKVLTGDSQLAKAATDAVKQWKYKPYLLNGEPVEIQTQVTIKFKLPR